MSVGSPHQRSLGSSLQDDEVVLQCSATVLKEQLKLCLAAEGFGNRLCFLEPTSNAQVCGRRPRGVQGGVGARSWGARRGSWSWKRGEERRGKWGGA